MCGRDPINAPSEEPTVGMLNAIRLVVALLCLPLMLVGIVCQLSAFPMLFADDLTGSAYRMIYSTFGTLLLGAIAWRLAQDALNDLEARPMK